VEAGFLTGISFAPWRTNFNHDEEQVGSWPIRFLLFKLMLMSGIVKIQANCPTWKNLTALEYHFATQCLPGPFAWHAHQLPPILLRLGVAATFVIEIPFFLFTPITVWYHAESWILDANFAASADHINWKLQFLQSTDDDTVLAMYDW
jgi:hypothetical protein